MKTALSLLACAATAVLVTGCGSLADSLFESALDSAFGSKEDRRANYYESRGVGPKRAKRMAFEDKVWGDL